MSRETAKKLLVVEDDRALEPTLRGMVARLSADTEMDWVTSAEEALKRIHGRDYDLVLTDIGLEGGSTGLELVEVCRRAGSQVPFVVTSSSPPRILHGECRAPFVPKPMTMEKFARYLGPYLVKDAGEEPERMRLSLNLRDPAVRAGMLWLYFVVLIWGLLSFLVEWRA